MTGDPVAAAHATIQSALDARRIDEETAVGMHGAVELLGRGEAESAYPPAELESRLAELFALGIDGERLVPR